MGLGKTIMALGLILKSQEIKLDYFEDKISKKNKSFRGKTLLVV